LCWTVLRLATVASRILWRFASVVKDEEPSLFSTSLRIVWRKERVAESPRYTGSVLVMGRACAYTCNSCIEYDCTLAIAKWYCSPSRPSPSCSNRPRFCIGVTSSPVDSLGEGGACGCWPLSTPPLTFSPLLRGAL